MAISRDRDLKMQAIAVVMKSSMVLVALVLLLLAKAEAQGSAVAVASANNQELNITSQVDDYVIEKKRLYAANIRAMDAQLAEVKARYDHQLNVINAQTEYLNVQLQQVEEKLLPLELISDLSKHCVQKYHGQIVTVASVNSQIASCVAGASNAYSSFVSNPTTTRNNLNNWYNGQFVNLINDCKKKYPNAQLNYTICATQAVASGDSVTASYKKTFDTQMQTASCSAEGRVKLAVDCSFTIVYSTTSTIGQVMHQINHCSQGLDVCPPCAVEPVQPAPECPSKVYTTTDPNYFRNATIVNPFLGFNQTSCIEVHFSDLS